MRPPLRVPVEQLSPGERVLDAEASHYVARVHRLAAGDAIVAFDVARAEEADGEVVVADARAARVRLHAPRPASRRAPHAFTLLQALGKGDKPDQVMRDLTALGANAVWWLETERSVPRLGERAARKAQRWRQIAIEAARQCGRGDALDAVGPLPFDEALVRAPRGRRLLLSTVDAPELLAVLHDWQPAEALVALVGPEGGLSPAEHAAAVAAGFAPVSLGPFVLRTETAAASLAAVLLALAMTRR